MQTSNGLQSKHYMQQHQSQCNSNLRLYITRSVGNIHKTTVLQALAGSANLFIPDEYQPEALIL